MVGLESPLGRAGGLPARRDKVKVSALLHYQFRQPARCRPRKRHVWGRRQSRWQGRRRLCCLTGTLCRPDYSRVRQGGQLVATRPELLVAHRCFSHGGGTIPSIRGCAMLESLSDPVRECLDHAEDCLQRAASQTDPEPRRHFLIIGACWLKLGSELSEPLANYSNIETGGLAALTGEPRSEVHAPGPCRVGGAGGLALPRR